MRTSFTVILLCEVAVLIFLVWGWMHESIFIAFELKAAKKIKKAARTIKRYIKAFILALCCMPLEKAGYKIKKG